MVGFSIFSDLVKAFREFFSISFSRLLTLTFIVVGNLSHLFTNLYIDFTMETSKIGIISGKEENGKGHTSNHTIQK